MAHSTECTNNFDPNCEECIAWKKYREDLKERRKFLESYWIHLDKPKNNVVTCHHEIKDADNSFRNFKVSKPTADSICPNCEISFKTKKTLKAHIKTVHDRKHVYSFVECGENFLGVIIWMLTCVVTGMKNHFHVTNLKNTLNLSKL